MNGRISVTLIALVEFAAAVWLLLASVANTFLLPLILSAFTIYLFIQTWRASQVAGKRDAGKVMLPGMKQRGVSALSSPCQTAWLEPSCFESGISRTVHLTR